MKVNLVPVLSENVSEQGIAFASSEFSSAFKVYRLFDGFKEANSIQGGWATVSGTNKGYAGFKFNRPTVVNSYTLYPRSGRYSENPRHWKFEASNDGVKYYVLDEVVREKWDSPEGANYEFDNNHSFFYYRINILDNFGFPNYTVIQEMELHLDVSRYNRFQLVRKGEGVGFYDRKGWKELEVGIHDYLSSPFKTNLPYYLTNGDLTGDVEFIESDDSFLKDLRELPRLKKLIIKDDIYEFERVSPVMNGYQNSEAIVRAEGEYSGDYVAWLAFDDDKIGYKAWATTPNSPNQWIEMEFTQPKIINAYTIKVRGSTSLENPHKWIIQGSNDGKIYEDLSEVTTDKRWNPLEKREFEFDNTKSYKIYRFQILKNEGYAGYTTIQEIVWGHIQNPLFYFRDNDFYYVVQGDSLLRFEDIENARHYKAKTFNLEDVKYIKYGETQEEIPSDFWDNLTMVTDTEGIVQELYANHNLDHFLTHCHSILDFDKQNHSPSITYEVIPDKALLLANGDFALKTVDNIDFFKIDFSRVGDADIKLITSVDEGETWKSYDGSSWIDIEPNVDEVGLYGIPVEQFNNIPSEKWNDLRKYSNKIRFGYYLKHNEPLDVAKIHALNAQFDMTGEWFSANKGTDYKYSYPDNSTIKVTILKNGDYKINY